MSGRRHRSGLVFQCIEWDHALPWITSLLNIVFVQPHGFLEESYMPLPIKDIDWEEVNYGDRDDYDDNVMSVYLHDYDYEHSMEVMVYQYDILFG